MLSLFQADPGPEEGPMDLVIELVGPKDVQLNLTGDNSTTISLTGFFRIEEATGADQLLTARAELSLNGVVWEANISPSSFDDLEIGLEYHFVIAITVPAGEQDGAAAAFTVTLVVSNVLNSVQDTDVFKVVCHRDRSDDGGGNILPLRVGAEFPWAIFIFAVGLLSLIATGIVWAVRNYELVREIGGSRRIMLREKRSGRLLKGRKPPGPQV